MLYNTVWSLSKRWFLSCQDVLKWRKCYLLVRELLWQLTHCWWMESVCLTLREHLGYILFLIFLVFSIVLLICFFTIWVPCYDIWYDYCIKTMFGSSLPPVLMSYLRYLCLFTHSGVQHILCCVFGLLFFVLCTLFAGCSGFSIVDCSFSIL